MKFIRRNRFKVNKIKLLSIKITDCGRTFTGNGKKHQEEEETATHPIHKISFIELYNSCSTLKEKRKQPMLIIFPYVFCVKIEHILWKE